jgi:hypothetical protein
MLRLGAVSTRVLRVTLSASRRGNLTRSLQTREIRIPPQQTPWGIAARQKGQTRRNAGAAARAPPPAAEAAIVQRRGLFAPLRNLWYGANNDGAHGIYGYLVNAVAFGSAVFPISVMVCLAVPSSIGWLQSSPEAIECGCVAGVGLGLVVAGEEDREFQAREMHRLVGMEAWPPIWRNAYKTLVETRLEREIDRRGWVAEPGVERGASVPRQLGRGGRHYRAPRL